MRIWYGLVLTGLIVVSHPELGVAQDVPDRIKNSAFPELANLVAKHLSQETVKEIIVRVVDPTNTTASLNGFTIALCELLKKHNLEPTTKGASVHRLTVELEWKIDPKSNTPIPSLKVDFKIVSGKSEPKSIPIMDAKILNPYPGDTKAESTQLENSHLVTNNRCVVINPGQGYQPEKDDTRKTPEGLTVGNLRIDPADSAVFTIEPGHYGIRVTTCRYDIKKRQRLNDGVDTIKPVWEAKEEGIGDTRYPIFTIKRPSQVENGDIQTGFQIELLNKDPQFEAATTVAIDGLDVLSLRDKEYRQEKKDVRYVLIGMRTSKGSGSSKVDGYWKNPEEQWPFIIGRRGDIAGETFDRDRKSIFDLTERPSGTKGMIHVQFHRAAESKEKLGASRSGSNPYLEIIPGLVEKKKTEVTSRFIGDTLATISVRYVIKD